MSFMKRLEEENRRLQTEVQRLKEELTQKNDLVLSLEGQIQTLVEGSDDDHVSSTHSGSSSSQRGSSTGAATRQGLPSTPPSSKGKRRDSDYVEESLPPPIPRSGATSRSSPEKALSFSLRPPCRSDVETQQPLPVAPTARTLIAHWNRKDSDDVKSLPPSKPRSGVAHRRYSDDMKSLPPPKPCNEEATSRISPEKALRSSLRPPRRSNVDILQPLPVAPTTHTLTAHPSAPFTNKENVSESGIGTRLEGSIIWEGTEDDEESEPASSRRVLHPFKDENRRDSDDVRSLPSLKFRSDATSRSSPEKTWSSPLRHPSRSTVELQQALEPVAPTAPALTAHPSAPLTNKENASKSGIGTRLEGSTTRKGTEDDEESEPASRRRVLQPSKDENRKDSDDVRSLPPFKPRSDATSRSSPEKTWTWSPPLPHTSRSPVELQQPLVPVAPTTPVLTFHHSALLFNKEDILESGIGTRLGGIIMEETVYDEDDDENSESVASRRRVLQSVEGDMEALPRELSIFNSRDDDDDDVMKYSIDDGMSTYEVEETELWDAYNARGSYSGTVSRAEQMPHGRGRMEYDHEGRCYEGDWHMGHWHGYGIIQNAAGDVFDGKVVNDLKEGDGKMNYADGRVFSGRFERNETVEGILVFPDGAKYIGEVHDGARHGNGVYWFVDGSTYDGQPVMNIFEGKGKMMWTDGGWIEGGWSRGEMHGYGMELRADGSMRNKSPCSKDLPVRLA